MPARLAREPVDNSWSFPRGLGEMPFLASEAAHHEGPLDA